MSSWWLVVAFFVGIAVALLCIYIKASQVVWCGVIFVSAVVIAILMAVKAVRADRRKIMNTKG